jgi:hypothetical protein
MFRPIWSPSGASKISVENCCTSINEYISKVYPRLSAHILLYMAYFILFFALGHESNGLRKLGRGGKRLRTAYRNRKYK